MEEQSIRGDLLLEARKQSGMSIDELAKVARVDASRIELAEASDVKVPYVAVDRIAIALKLETSDIWLRPVPEILKPNSLSTEPSMGSLEAPNVQGTRAASAVGTISSRQTFADLNVLSFASFIAAMTGAAFPFAIIFGHIGLRQLKADNRQHGAGFAQIGLVLGYIELVMFSLFILSWFSTIMSD